MHSELYEQLRLVNINNKIIDYNWRLGFKAVIIIP